MATVDDDIVTRWPIAVPPYSQIDVAVVHEERLPCVQDAWQYLLENGKACATDGGIRPEELILGELSLFPRGYLSPVTHSDPCRDPSRFLCQGFQTEALYAAG